MKTPPSGTPGLVLESTTAVATPVRGSRGKVARANAPGAASQVPPILKPQANSHRALVNLDGFWSFRRDPEGLGEREGWTTGFTPECELAVPASWNEQRLELMHYFGRG